MGQRITVVDAFTDRPYSGNPAGVCVLDRAADEEWMQAVAAEMNLAETAFLVPRDDGALDLRWFTPTTEVPLCGHATLASAHVLGGEQRFHTRSGVLTGRPARDGRIEIDLPAIPVARVADPPDWAAALGVAPERVLGVWSGREWVLVQLAFAFDVRGLRPDRQAILDLGGAVIAFATPGDQPGVDSICRFFAPGLGIDEDPVTGAAHCVIGPWLAEKTSGRQFTGIQASRRGGRVGMRVAGDRVVLSGHAVTTLEATLLH